MKFGDKEYSFVPDRLKQFREENPRASIDTAPTYNEDGSVTFKATIIKDQSDEYSAKGTGNARYSQAEISKPKAFEKLETISMGRALANIGYLNDGRVATTEEMEDFLDFKSDKYREAIETATTVEELMRVFTEMDAVAKREFTPLLSEKKKELLSVTK